MKLFNKIKEHQFFGTHQHKSKQIYSLASALILVAGIPSTTSAATSVHEDFIYGSCIHLGHGNNKFYNSGPETENKLLQIGAQSTRDDLSWDITKATSPRTLPTSMNAISYSLNNIKAKPLLILTGNAEKIPEGHPNTTETRTAFASYARHAAKTLKSVNPIFEIWNEWNIGAWNLDRKHGSPENYVELAKVAYPEIKKELPDGIVLVGAVGDDTDWKWTIKAVELGLMNYGDALSVHVYNHCSNPIKRTGSDVIIRLQSLHDKLIRITRGREFPIYLTEFGWPTHDGECGGVSEETVANNIAQVILWGPAFRWLKGAWIYELSDEGENPKDREHHFGQYRVGGSVKPSGCAAKTVWDFISDYSFINQSQPLPNIQMVTYSKGNQSHVALWNLGGSDDQHWVQIPNGASGVSLCGSPPAKANMWAPIGQTPILIELPNHETELIKLK